MDVRDQDAARAALPQRVRQVLIHRLPGQTGPGPSEFGGARLCLRHELPHQRRGDGEPDPVRSARTRQDRGIHPNEPPADIHKRPARIARIDRRIGLDEIAARIARGRARAREPRHNPRRAGLPDPERIADGQHQLAHLDRVALAQRQERHVARRVELEDRQIGLLVAQKHPRRELAPVVQHDPDVVSPAHHMVI